MKKGVGFLIAVIILLLVGFIISVAFGVFDKIVPYNIKLLILCNGYLYDIIRDTLGGGNYLYNFYTNHCIGTRSVYGLVGRFLIPSIISISIIVYFVIRYKKDIIAALKSK